MNPVQLWFCESFGINPIQFKKLARLVRHAVRMQEREHNEDSAAVREACSTAVDVVNEYAKECGFTRVGWDDGLYPRFYRNDKSELLPLD